MRTIEYSSNFATYILGMVEQKRALGYSYEEDALFLKRFDDFCTSRFPKESILTQEIVTSWATKRETEGNKSVHIRMHSVSELGRYIQRLGLEAFVLPPGFLPRYSRYVPHIYTIEELRLIFDIFDTRLLPTQRNLSSQLVRSVFFRLMYSCGLRPSEARELCVEDVDLNTGRVFVRESKGHKDRIVVMSRDVTLLCVKYRKQMQNLVPNTAYFFPTPKGAKYCENWVNHTFRKAVTLAGLKHAGANPPRAYDLRHTFATYRLYQWMKEGKDLDAYLPYLSAYMGHSDFSSTAYYIHFVPGIFENMSGFGFSRFESLIPEVQYND